MTIYRHHWKKGERQRKCLEYACLEDSELLYIFNQPDCELCQSYLQNGSLPIWCPECGTLRDTREPLMQEIERRGLNIYA